MTLPTLWYYSYAAHKNIQAEEEKEENLLSTSK